MTAEEAREISNNSIVSDVEAEAIYRSIDYDIREAAENGETICYPKVYGCDKPWEVIYRERELVKEHFTDLGFEVESLGYNRSCMWDEYEIRW